MYYHLHVIPKEVTACGYELFVECVSYVFKFGFDFIQQYKYMLYSHNEVTHNYNA